MIKFKSLEFLRSSQRFPGNIKNAFYRLEISALVQETFKFGKCVNYANQRTDDIIHSTQYDIKYMTRGISVNLQQKPLKLGRLIVLQATRLRLFKKRKSLDSHGNIDLFPSPQPDFIIFVIFSSKKILKCHKLDLTYLYVCCIMHLRHYWQISK